MKFKPLGDRVVIKQDDVQETTKGGLLLTSGSKEKPQTGTIVAAGKDGVTVACAGGQTVRITQLQAPGKKRMSAADYLLGHTLPVED